MIDRRAVMSKGGSWNITNAKSNDKYAKFHGSTRSEDNEQKKRIWLSHKIRVGNGIKESDYFECIFFPMTYCLATEVLKSTISASVSSITILMELLYFICRFIIENKVIFKD